MGRSRSPTCVEKKGFNLRSTKWSKAFLDSGKNGLTRETQRDATSGEVRRLKEENEALKKAVAEMVLEIQKLKKSMGL